MIEGGAALVLERVAPADASPAFLDGLVGRNNSEELDETYTIARAEEGLVLRRMKYPDAPLQPRYAGGFICDLGALHFVRDGEGRVTELWVTTGRVVNLRFSSSSLQLPASRLQLEGPADR